MLAKTALTYLNCAYNSSLTSIDVSQNTSLTIFYCTANSLSTLDLSSNINLQELYCQSNNLTSLNIVSGYNTTITQFHAINNPNLTCIQVDNVAYSTTNWTNIDAGASFSLSCAPCIVNIPDANFKAYLVGNTAINTNSDTEIQCSEASAFTGFINCPSLSISDLTGIEAFTSLDALYCQTNNLTTLDVTQNTALTWLQCFDNQLSNLDVSQNTALTYLDCKFNQLTSLNVTLHTALTNLVCNNNQLTTINIAQNTALTQLRCNTNQLTSLDVTQNTGLIELRCYNNLLTSLNVGNGNNANITNANFLAYNNPSLTCIQVDNVSYSTTNWTNIDAGASFSLSCAPCIVNIPDANFKAYLVGNTAINTNADAEIQCSEASAFTGQIDCSSLSISDLTGIEAFTSLTELHCYSNSLTSLDVSMNTALTVLRCENNSLTILDVSNNTALVYLYCYGNSLTSLDASNNTALSFLRCYSNSLSSLNVPSTTSLLNLECNDNSLTSLDVSTNTALTGLRCHNNSLMSLDISNNSALTLLYCQNNSLTSLNVANGNNVNLSSFVATGNPNLTCIQVDNVAYSTTNWTNIDAGASFSTNCSVGIEELSEQKINVYPNPVKNQITIDTKEHIKNITITNVSGKGIKTVVSSNNTVDVSNLVKGIYFLQVQTENGIANSKFIKE